MAAWYWLGCWVAATRPRSCTLATPANTTQHNL